MFRVTVLASGSRGNCTLIATSRTRVVLDAGLSCREIVKRMRLSGEEPENLDAILITHEHSDHVQGLSVLARRWNVPVYATEATHAAWKQYVSPRHRVSFQEWLEQRRKNSPDNDNPADGDLADMAAPTISLCASESAGENNGENKPEGPAPGFDSVGTNSIAAACEEELFPPEPLRDDPAYLPRVEFFQAGTPFEIGDISVTPFTIPHDAADPVGFVLEAEGMRVAVATDLGYLPPNVRMQLKHADLLMIESNHDLEMLRDGPYPWAVKQRVLSRVGHLSNEALADYLANEYDGSARFVVLAHLSESNNLPELARLSAERALENRMNLLGNKVLLASQGRPLESIHL